MTQIQVVQEPEVTTAVIRRRVAMTDLRDFFDTALPAVVGALDEQGATPTGPAFARFFGMPEESADLEVGFPVSQAIAASGEVRPGTLPACRIYQAIHTGSYDMLSRTYAAIAQRMDHDGVDGADQMWEYYLTDPGEVADPQQWQTRICWPFR